MNTNHEYDWGQTLQVDKDAPQDMNPNKLCSVCGMREVDGIIIYLVEFSNGEALEIPENMLNLYVAE